MSYDDDIRFGDFPPDRPETPTFDSDELIHDDLETPPNDNTQPDDLIHITPRTTTHWAIIKLPWKQPTAKKEPIAPALLQLIELGTKLDSTFSILPHFISPDAVTPDIHPLEQLLNRTTATAENLDEK
jgi:hypothetical protein